MTHHAQLIDPGLIVIGVDTHKDVHVGVALDHLGRSLGQQSVPTTSSGLRALLSWAQQIGGRRLWGVEGTGSLGVLSSQPSQLGPLISVDRARRMIGAGPFLGHPTPQQGLTDPDLARYLHDRATGVDHQTCGLMPIPSSSSTCETSSPRTSRSAVKMSVKRGEPHLEVRSPIADSPVPRLEGPTSITIGID